MSQGRWLDRRSTQRSDQLLIDPVKGRLLLAFTWLSPLDYASHFVWIAASTRRTTMFFLRDRYQNPNNDLLDLSP